MSYKFAVGMAVKHPQHGTGEIMDLSTKDLGDGTPPAASVDFGNHGATETVPLDMIDVDWKYYRENESVYNRDKSTRDLQTQITDSLANALECMGNVKEVVRTKYNRLLIRTNPDGIGFGNLHDRYNFDVTETWIINQDEMALSIEVKR